MSNDSVLEQLAELRERVATLEATQQPDGTIHTERIDIIGPDGGLRTSIANGDRSADTVIAGETIAPGRSRPGLIFFNDLGDECGGLTFAGHYGDDGQVEAWSGLTLDRFRHDQAIAVGYSEHDGTYEAGLRVVDRPAISLVDAIRRAKAGEPGTDLFGAERLFVGRTVDDDAVLELRDGLGRPRLRLAVTAEGAASVLFLDQDGEPLRKFVPSGHSVADPESE